MPYSRNEDGTLGLGPALSHEPAGPGNVVIGEPLGVGLHAEWIVLAFTETRNREGIVLVVRPHRYHPFVTERVYWRADDNAFIVSNGTYHDNVPEAWDTYLDRGGKVIDWSERRRLAGRQAWAGI